MRQANVEGNFGIGNKSLLRLLNFHKDKTSGRGTLVELYGNEDKSESNTIESIYRPSIYNGDLTSVKM